MSTKKIQILGSLGGNSNIYIQDEEPVDVTGNAIWIDTDDNVENDPVDMSNYATKEYVDKAVNSVDIPSIEGLATKKYVDDAIANIDIPSGGGSGGGTFKTDVLFNERLAESAAQLSVTLEKNYHKLILAWQCGSNGEERLVDTSGAPISGDLGVLINSTSLTWNSRKVGMINDSKSKWASSFLVMEWTKDLTTFVNSIYVDVGTGEVRPQNNCFGGTTAMIGTLGADALAPSKGNTISIVPSTGLFNADTKLVLVGEYIE